MNNLYILYEYVMDISDVIIYISVREFNPLSFSRTFRDISDVIIYTIFGKKVYIVP